MHCSEIQENLSAYLDGELDPDEESELKSHLEGCESCSRELESLRSTVELVRSVPRVQAPSALKQRLSSATSFRRPAWRFLNPVALASAAALIIVTVVAIFMLSPGHPGASNNLAIGPKEADDTTPTSEKFLSTRTKHAAVDEKLKPGGKAAGPQLGKQEAYAVKEERHKVREKETLGKLAPEKPARLPAYERALEKRLNRETLEDSDSEGGYERLADKLKAVERRSGEAKPHALQQAPAPPSAAIPAEKAQEMPSEAEELADRGSEDTREIVIETHDPAGTAAQVSKILRTHTGKKGVLTGAMLEGLAKASEEGEQGADDSIEITVYVNRAESGEIVAQLQGLKKQTMAGWSGRALGEPANERNEEREQDSSKKETKRKLKESQKKTKGEAGPTEGAGISKEKQEQEKIPAKRMPGGRIEPDKSFGKSPDSSGDGAKKQTDLKKKDEKADQPEEEDSQRIAILIRIVRAKPVPDNLLKKALEKEVRPNPATKGK